MLVGIYETSLAVQLKNTNYNKLTFAFNFNCDYFSVNSFFI